MGLDRAARYGIAFGGISVIVAIVLIFFYLLYVVYPLFVPADAEPLADYAVPQATAGETLLLAVEEQGEVGLRLTRGGQAVFFETASGRVIKTAALPLPPGSRITAFAAGVPESGVFALGLDSGALLLVRHVYKTAYAQDGTRSITPTLAYPYGEAPLDLAPEALVAVGVQSSDQGVTAAAVTVSGGVELIRYTKEESFLDIGGASGDFTLSRGRIAGTAANIATVLIDRIQERLYLIEESGRARFFDISEIETPRRVERLALVPAGVAIVAADFLIGTTSLLVAGDDGQVRQWFPVRSDDNEEKLKLVRSFDTVGGLAVLVPEHRRKGFATFTADGRFQLFNATAHRLALTDRLAETPVMRAALAPRANFLLAETDGGRLHWWRIHNEHPDVSWHALWRKVWYENYEEPAYIWQSSAATNDFEPKYSLVPLSFGTLKAAFYAMLFAVPVSILGAIYTGYFMAPRMRGSVKPVIEIMEALPTVILGFLAGLWLAPFLEAHLAGVFAILVITPLGILCFSYLYYLLPQWAKNRIPEGWEGALLIPGLILLVGLALALGAPLEEWLFAGDLKGWMTNDLGISFDQRNSMVVGIAMGVAVIPTIFSITEDAIFSVPKHLTQGSLARGATTGQTMVRVVILTASPGIFSAVMIGVGRAVGETMIVLMATGNTPVMDFSIFQGMRTLSANIAVEMPESEVNSTHYRVLFLAALVLFLFTFFFNTAAELVRQRLREKYSSL
ncbi:MAG: ABC transporter permease subunit [Pseudomonadota bacterium]|nr:ABC transporter permease subunit [Pseudomonadota bacterium]